MKRSLLEKALLIRRTEETLLELFSQGKLNGTVHTCIGQEMSAIAFAGQLNQDDFIFSNHRCHGHYLSYTDDVKGLLAELMGRKEGTCAGIGSSQHLCKGNFYSNGIQGGIVPVAAGMALANKIKNNHAVGIVFIGDGTLGQGVIYEAMNMIGKWNLPVIIVCEDNGYAQTTVKDDSFSGDLSKRAEGFGIDYRQGNTWEYDELISEAEKAISDVRTQQKPIFFHVKTYRLAAHSKGDDTRELSEVESYQRQDPVNIFAQTNPETYQEVLSEVNKTIASCSEVIQSEELSLESYFDKTEVINEYSWTKIVSDKSRMVDRINRVLKDLLHDERMIFIGEDVLSPYGGAFKVAKDLSAEFPKQVFSTPISEAGLVGISNGLALAGFKPYAEIMFGDFMTLALDQIVNHASKFYHMYNKQVTCPLVVRTPMGGGRGYGPTHSQTLDKFLIGIDNVKTVSLNQFIDPKYIYKSVHQEVHPVIIIENKLDYGTTLLTKPKLGFSYEQSNHNYPYVKISPQAEQTTITIVAHGGAAGIAESILHELFIEHEIIAEVIIPSLISPLDITPILKSVSKTNKLFILDEGSKEGSFSSEVLSSVIEKSNHTILCKRISSTECPIPSIRHLESQVLLSKTQVITEIVMELA